MKYLLLLLLSIFFLSCSKITPIDNRTLFKASYLKSEDLKKVDFKNQEIVSIKLKDNFYYVRRDGKLMLALTNENEADPFSDGLARTKINGKIGFFNSNLDIILKPIYDFAFPFHKGVAEICIGCKEKSTEGASLLDGGKWKKINRDGLVIE